MVARRCGTAIHRKPLEDDRLAERLEHLGASVTGSVIYNDDFLAGLLPQRRFHGFPYELLVVVTRNYNAEKRL